MKVHTPHIHNFSGHVLTARGLQQVERAARTAVRTGEVQSVQAQIMRGLDLKVRVHPNGMVTL